MKKKNNEKLDKKLLIKNLKSLWKYLKGTKKYIILYIIMLLFNTIVGVIIPLVSTKIVLYLTDGIFSSLLLTGAIILGIKIVDEIIGYFEDYCREYINNKCSNQLQLEFVKEFLKLEIKEIDKSSTGAFIERINYDTNSMTYIFFSISYNISSILSKVGTLVTVFILNKYIFAYLIVVALINLYLGEVRNKIQEKNWQTLRNLREEKTTIISELVRGIRDIKVLNATDTIMQKTGENITKVSKESFKSSRISSGFFVIFSLVNNITDYLFLIIGVLLCTNDMMNIPTFLILYNYSGRIAYLFRGITDLTSTFREFNVAAERVFAIINDGTYAKETFGDKKVKKIKGNIDFNNVTFSYDDKHKVIKNMSFSIKPNETVGFVGKSGAGKSTIFSLITKLYNIKEGSITIDNIDIKDLNKNSLRDNMSIITQNPYIFNFSIRENLLLANPHAKMKDIRKACKLACIDEYIMSLDDKYETKLGEGGLILSGGQRQRLAIARALLMKTEIILFDEATSALDNETQEEIQKAIDNLKGEYTMLIIAHRLSTVIDCDKIFVVDKGQIVACGTHQELINSCKEYQSLYKKELFK